MELEYVPGPVFLEDLANLSRTLQVPSIQREIYLYDISSQSQGLDRKGVGA